MNVSVSHPTNRPNFTVVQLGNLSVWFSYETPIAFQSGHGRIVVRENEWGPTTGKHIGYVNPDKGARVDGVVFESMLARVLPTMETV